MSRTQPPSSQDYVQLGPSTWEESRPDVDFAFKRIFGRLNTAEGRQGNPHIFSTLYMEGNHILNGPSPQVNPASDEFITKGYADGAYDPLSTTRRPTSTGLTAPRIPFATAGDQLSDSADLTFSHSDPTLTIGVATVTRGRLQLTGSTSGVVTIQPATAAGTWTFQLPTSAGTANYALLTDGSGVTTWASAASIAGAVIGSGSSTDTAIPTWSGTSGTVLQNSDMTYVSGLLTLPSGSAINASNGSLNMSGGSGTIGDFSVTNSLITYSSLGIRFNNAVQPATNIIIGDLASNTLSRNLTFNVSNANRTVSLSGNLTVSSAATISGTNTGDQTITLTGDVTGSGTGSFATTVGKVNGVTYGASPSTNTVPVVTGSNTVTYEAVPNAALANSAITIAGTSAALGGSITLDTITGVSSNGYLKRTGANTLTNVSSIPNTDLANSSITLNAGTNFGITAPGAMSLGSTYTIGATTDVLRFARLGLGTAADATAVVNTTGIISSGVVTNASGNFYSAQNGNGDGFIADCASNTTTDSVVYKFQRSAGTQASRSVILNATDIGDVLWNAYNGSSFVTRAKIDAVVNGTVSGSTIPTDLEFYTGSTGVTKRLTIDSGGTSTFTGTGQFTRLGLGAAADGTYGLLTQDLTSAAKFASASNVELAVMLNVWAEDRSKITIQSSSGGGSGTGGGLFKIYTANSGGTLTEGFSIEKDQSVYLNGTSANHSVVVSGGLQPNFGSGDLHVGTSSAPFEYSTFQLTHGGMCCSSNVTPNTTANSTTMAANETAYIPESYEILSNANLEIGSGGVLEIG